jgi:hypothetical protein
LDSDALAFDPPMRLPAALVLLLALLPDLEPRATRVDCVEAGTVQRLEIEELLGQCEQALEGRVQNIRVVEAGRKRIETEITLSVSRRFWGGGGREFVLRVPGGVLPDGRGLVLPGLPRFAEGEELLLFLSAESRLGTRVPVGLAQGRFRIERRAGGGKTLVRDQDELEFYDPRTRTASRAEPRALFDYAAVVARIEAAAQQRRQRESRGGGR